MVLLLYLSRESSDFHEFGAQTQIMLPKTVICQSAKILHIQMADGRHIEDRFRLYLKRFIV